MAKPIFVNFTDHNGDVVKTYTTVSIKTGMMDKVFDLAERAEELEKKREIKEVRVFYGDLKALIVDLFGRQFTFDELNDNVDQDELMAVLGRLVGRISGGMRKN
ncbi:phage tail assembly chaperone G [Cohnella sp.]|uniref:phage tail assembly chaperone G n=1 Tax=Cohnella sp. TaxID=1883426 RepID=UPI00356450F3